VASGSRISGSGLAKAGLGKAGGGLDVRGCCDAVSVAGHVFTSFWGRIGADWLGIVGSTADVGER
jgi:hypothetical protein